MLIRQLCRDLYVWRTHASQITLIYISIKSIAWDVPSSRRIAHFLAFAASPHFTSFLLSLFLMFSTFEMMSRPWLLAASVSFLEIAGRHNSTTIYQFLLSLCFLFAMADSSFLFDAGIVIFVVGILIFFIMFGCYGAQHFQVISKSSPAACEDSNISRQCDGHSMIFFIPLPVLIR